jgi:hypothetical protein
LTVPRLHAGSPAPFHDRDRPLLPGGAAILKLFYQETAKFNGPRKKDKQLNLWSVRSIPKAKGPAESLARHNLCEIAVLWTLEVKGMDLPQVATLRERCADLAGTLSNRHGHVFSEMRKLSLNHPSDVAAYLVLNELDKKGARETHGYRLKVLEFGIGALLEGKN